MLFRSKNSGVIHTGIMCNACKTKSFSGIRYTCVECKNFDLCQNCERETNMHSQHIMIRLYQKSDKMPEKVKRAVAEGSSEAFGLIREILEKELEGTQMGMETKERVLLLKTVLGVTDQSKIERLVNKYGSFNRDEFIERCFAELN